MPWLLLGKAWHALANAKQPSGQEKVARLRADILPEEPDAKICPMCLRVFFADELRGGPGEPR